MARCGRSVAVVASVSVGVALVDDTDEDDDDVVDTVDCDAVTAAGFSFIARLILRCRLPIGKAFVG